MFAAFDFGIKRTICANWRNAAAVTYFPHRPSEEILKIQPDGVFLPMAAIRSLRLRNSAIQALLEKNIPIFGICLVINYWLSQRRAHHQNEIRHHGAIIRARCQQRQSDHYQSESRFCC